MPREDRLLLLDRVAHHERVADRDLREEDRQRGAVRERRVAAGAAVDVELVAVLGHGQLLAVGLAGVRLEHLERLDARAVGQPRRARALDRLLVEHLDRKLVRAQVGAVLVEAHVDVEALHAREQLGLIALREGGCGEAQAEQRGEQSFHCSVLPDGGRIMPDARAAFMPQTCKFFRNSPRPRGSDRGREDVLSEGRP